MAFRQHVARLVRNLPGLMQILYYVHRFIQPKYSAGVIGVVINDDGKILLVEHVFHPHFPWGLPGGWIGLNEDPQQAIKRELLEELQLNVTIQQMILCRRTQYNHLDIAFLCEPENAIGDLSYELLTYDWHTPDNLPHLYSFHREAILKAHQQHHTNGKHPVETPRDTG